MMRLSLNMTKNYNVKNYNKPSHINIAVVDLDISNSFPTNFLCLLPKRLFVTPSNQTVFQKKFGKQSQKILKDLLMQTLKITGDPDFKRELESRLKIVNPKPKNLVKCNICSKEFIARKLGYKLQRTCYSCKNKGH